MSTLLLPALKGVNVSMQITPQDQANGGVLTSNAAGAFSFNGRLDTGAPVQINLSTDNISPTNAFQGNPVPIEQNATLRVTEILQALPNVDGSNKGAGFSGVLDFVLSLSFYHKLVVTKLEVDESTDIKVATYYLVLTSTGDTGGDKGKNTQTAEFATVLVVDSSDGTYIPNPAYS